MNITTELHPVKAIAPQALAADTPAVGSVIDRRGFGGVTFVIATGAIADADATFAVKLEHGDAANLADATDVTAADLIGTVALAAFRFDDDNETRKIGYRGSRRYVRITITPTGNAADALISALAILGTPHVAPVANPPV